MKRYDLHIHTNYSPCSFNKPETILKVAKKKGLDGIAITDHHTTKGADKVIKLNKDKNFEVIKGEEITTEYGDVVAIYIKKQIKSRALFEVIEEVKRQNGLLFVAHPFRFAPWQRFKYPLDKLKGKIDGIEAFNSRNIGRANKKAEKKADKIGIAKIGSSDAHIPIDIGNGMTLFEGDLRKAIMSKKTSVKGTTRYAILSGMAAMLRKRVITPLGVKK